MIEIKKNITISDIDQLYEDLKTKEKLKRKIDLLLPKQLENNDFGVLFSLIQFAATWVRSDYSGTLILPVNDIKEYEEYLFKEFVYPLVVLSWEKKILNRSRQDIRQELKAPSKKYFQHMEYFTLPKNESTPIFCFDHDLSKRGYSRAFYELEDILPEGALDYTLYPAYQKLKNNSRETFKSALGDSVIVAFSAIIHELFNNTHEHARTDEKGFNLYPNIRAVYLKFHKRRIDSHIGNYYNKQPGLLEYFDSAFHLNKQNEVYLLEISVLDSGPGLVKRYKKTSSLEGISIEEEVEIIKECLHKRNTSAVGADKEIKGLGLDRVLQTIDGKGFIRIKSGRVDVFRNMKRHRYKAHKTPSDIILYDWLENTPESFKMHPEATGTLISIIYPLDYRIHGK